MKEIVDSWKNHAKEEYDENLIFLKSLKGNRSVDESAASLDNTVFDKVDCLKCANCCKTTPAIVSRPDVKRIAKYLRVLTKTFIKKFLIEDYDGSLMINGVPCSFLNKDNTCQIYEVRPVACREYPHTAQFGFHRRSRMNAQNTLVCPAAYEIVKRLKGIHQIKK